MEGSGQNAERGSGAEVSSSSSPDTQRERSRIAFPYMDLDEAIRVATVIHRNVALGICESDQLASWLSLSPNSSGFRVRVSTAKIFGLVDGRTSGPYRLTELGKKIVDPANQATAKVDAFLTVPLFGAVYERYRGSNLPPATALETEFRGLGVAKKQSGKARGTFERSAQTAEFFKEGRDRLVKPGFAQTEEVPDELTDEEDSSLSERRNDGGGNGRRHPFIEGLLATLPMGAGPWEMEGRVAWLKAAAMGFDLIYGFKGEINIETKTTEDDSAPSAV